MTTGKFKLETKKYKASLRNLKAEPVCPGSSVHFSMELLRIKKFESIN